MFVNLLEARVGKLVFAAVVVRTGRIEHCLRFHEAFGLAFHAVHRDLLLRGTAHHDLLRQNLVTLAEQHIKAVDDFFLARIVPFGFIANPARKHGEFSHHALLQQGRSLLLGKEFRLQGVNALAEVLVIGPKLMHGRIEIAEDSNLHVRTDIAHLLGTEHRHLGAPD